jgi:uncharacterized protein
MANLYRIPVALLLRDVPSTSAVSFEAPFDEEHVFEPRGAAETDVVADSLVTVDVKLQSFVGGLHVRGTVSAPWQGTCRRCSIPVLGVSRVEVRERFVDEPKEGDEEVYPIVNDFIDLAPLVHDAIFLDLPLAPLCREDCQGLCPVCGIDRNDATCTCQQPGDPRWATLESLRFTGDEPDESEEV